MTIYNLGSVNIDHFYQVPHLPREGETVAARTLSRGLGGKGTNQSVAAALCGSDVVHIGAVGSDGLWAKERLASFGVDVENLCVLDGATGHAIIQVDPDAHNMITIFPGANVEQELQAVSVALDRAGSADTLLLQNETSHQVETAVLAAGRGMRIIYSAAPFDPEAVAQVLPHITILAMNAVEAEQLGRAMGCSLADLKVPEILVTFGDKGAYWRDQKTGARVDVPGFAVDAVDTTGAGDTFLGYFASGLDLGFPVEPSLLHAAAAAAIKVTRAGTADAIPGIVEVKTFLESLP